VTYCFSTDGAPGSSPAEIKPPELTDEQLKELAANIVSTSKAIEQYIGTCFRIQQISHLLTRLY
jgi:hypothetical protein